jgi:hypothetical protein
MSADAVDFEVAYGFGEYRQFLFEHVAHVKRRPGFLLRIFLSGLAAVVFAVKKHKMPLCKFHIDDEGVRRWAGGGQLAVPWSQVTAIYRYAPGYIIEKKGGKGAMPIPFRCLDEGQKATLERLLAVHDPRRRA